MVSQKYKVGIDLDGVIWEILDPLLKKYNKITNENIFANDIKSYNLNKYLKWPELVETILEQTCFWDEVELYPQIFDAIESLVLDERIDLQIVTATSYKTAGAKIARLLSLLPILKNSDITMTERKDLLDLNFLVDDCAGNLIRTGKNYNDKIYVPILINKPYTKSFHWGEIGIYNCDSLMQAVNFIKYIIDFSERERGTLVD